MRALGRLINDPRSLCREISRAGCSFLLFRHGRQGRTLLLLLLLLLGEGELLPEEPHRLHLLKVGCLGLLARHSFPRIPGVPLVPAYHIKDTGLGSVAVADSALLVQTVKLKLVLVRQIVELGLILCRKIPIGHPLRQLLERHVVQRDYMLA